jgi:hypothetical protein
MRPCNPTALGIPFCAELTSGTRCPAHERQYQQRRPSTGERGYGAAHQSVKAQLAASLPAQCGYCGVYIDPGEPWHAAHVVDGQPERGYVVAHPRCNLRARA